MIKHLKISILLDKVVLPFLRITSTQDIDWFAEEKGELNAESD